MRTYRLSQPLPRFPASSLSSASEARRDCVALFFTRSVMMAETREITLTEENWKKIDELLERIPDSGFLRFCLVNDIVEKGLVKHIVPMTFPNSP